MNRRALLRACGAVVSALLLTAAGCGQYPEVTSAESLRFIKQVYTACNTRSSVRLAACEARLDELHSTGQMTDAERQAFDDILAQANAGAWQEAAESSLEFAEDQVR